VSGSISRYDTAKRFSPIHSLTDICVVKENDKHDAQNFAFVLGFVVRHSTRAVCVRASTSWYDPNDAANAGVFVDTL